MKMNYVLIKNGIVVSVIFADDEFIKTIREQYDLVFPYQLAQWCPGPGWRYDGIKFLPPQSEITSEDQ